MFEVALLDVSSLYYSHFLVINEHSIIIPKITTVKEMNKRGKLNVAASGPKSSPSKTTQSSLSKYFGGTPTKKDEEEVKKTETTIKV